MIHIDHISKRFGETQSLDDVSIEVEEGTTFGLIGLGNKESLQFTPHERDFEQLEPGIKIYRRIR